MEQAADVFLSQCPPVLFLIVVVAGVVLVLPLNGILAQAKLASVESR